MAFFKKEEEVAKVGRPKLAEEDLIKDSWCRIGSAVAISLVMTICAIGVFTERTPLQVMTFYNPNKVQASAAKVVAVRNISAQKAKVIEVAKTVSANRSTKIVINKDGTVTRIVPAAVSNTVTID